MNDLDEGMVLEVQATDKGSKADLAAWANTVGHQYIRNSRRRMKCFITIFENVVMTHLMRKHLNHTISQDEIETRDGLILDVREEAEYAFGHIEGAKSIPMGELESHLDELDQTQEIYVICRTGKRSDMAAQLLVKNGFTKVYNVLPGMTEWNGKIIKEI